MEIFFRPCFFRPRSRVRTDEESMFIKLRYINFPVAGNTTPGLESEHGRA